MSDDPVWFYVRQGERRGPVAADVLLALRRSGGIEGSDLVWRDGLADWIPFSASELAPIAASASAGAIPPPPSPVLSPAPPARPGPEALFTPRPARLRPGFRPRLRETYGRAWSRLAARFWPSVGCFALTSLMLGVASQFYAPLFFLMFPLMGGLYWYFLLPMRGQEVAMDALFEGFRRQFGPLAVLNLVVVGISTAVALALLLLLVGGVIVGTEMLDSGAGGQILPAAIIAGSVLLVLVLLIPVLVFSLVGNLAAMLSLDCGLKAGESLSLAWAGTRPHLGKFTLFAMANVALSFVGLLALYFGAFITGAWSTIALVQIYEDAFGDDPDPAA